MNSRTDEPSDRSGKRTAYLRRTVGAAIILLLFGFVCYTQITVFLIQPIGAVPEGKTLVLWRESTKLNFIDSADAICARAQGGVSLLCRAIILEAVLKNNPILLRLPYSNALYLESTDGLEYGR